MRTYLVSYAVAMGSLLAGAAVVHNVYRPDLVSSTCMHSHMLAPLATMLAAVFSLAFKLRASREGSARDPVVTCL